MYSVEINGATLHYDRLGKGEPLVLIHGLGERKEGWASQHELSNRYDLIIPDLRGFGKSTLPKNKKIKMRDFAEDILGLLEHLKIEKSHICGVSMGGAVALEIFKMNKHKVKSLMLLNSFFYFPKVIGHYVLYRRLKSIDKVDFNEYKRSIIRACLHSHKEKYIEKGLLSCSDNVEGYKSAAYACLVDYRRLLPKINVPTLVIGCENDRIIPYKTQQKMASKIPNSNFTLIREAGHAGKIEKYEEFNRAILDFLESVSDSESLSSKKNIHLFDPR